MAIEVPVALQAVEVHLDFMLAELLLGRKDGATLVAFIPKVVVCNIHVTILSRLVVEPEVTGVALVGRATVAGRVAVLLAGLPTGREGTVAVGTLKHGCWNRLRARKRERSGPTRDR